MITVVEQDNWIEGVFQTKEAAQKYLNARRKKNLKLTELDFDTFPVYLIERGSVNIYTSSQEEVIAYANSFELKYLWGENDVAFNINYLAEPFNRRDEPMYFIDHSHIAKDDLKRLRKNPEGWFAHFGQLDNVKRLLREQSKQKTCPSRLKKELRMALHLCTVFSSAEIEKISMIYHFETYIVKNEPEILLYEKDKRGKRPLSIHCTHYGKAKENSVKATFRDILVKMDRKPPHASEAGEDGFA